MPVYHTYASRLEAAARAGAPDFYRYDELPSFLRRQISKIVTGCIGPGYPDERRYSEVPPNANHIWEDIANLMDREIPSFCYQRGEYAFDHCMEYLLRSNDLSGVLSFVEICARLMMNLAKDDPGTNNAYYRGAEEEPREGLSELNERFRQAGVGYQFENGDIIRIDSQYLHAEVVKEELRLLSEPEFAEANTEFMTAHRHLRDGKLRDCNTAALRATENVLKVICAAHNWIHDEGDTVERLLAGVRREGLFPDYLGGYFDNLIGAMKAGGPKIRDRQGGHGAAPGDNPVPDHIAAFSLHLTAANIVMLVKAHQAFRSPSPPEDVESE